MSNIERKPPHVALFPTAGMGHLTPFLRLATMLAANDCHVTFITVKPTVSFTESAHMDAFFSSHPQINRLEFEIPTFKPSDSTTDDPFFLQFDAISKSGHILAPLLSSTSPPIASIFSDFAVGVCIIPIAENLRIPNYSVLTSSARFFSLMASLPSFVADFNKSNENVSIEGLPPFPVSCIPPPFFNPNHLFTKLLTSNARLVSKSKGILLNTFDSFESETITVLKNGGVIKDLPPIFSIGPFPNHKIGPSTNSHSWLDNQKAGTVVYVSFGSRTALSKDQIRELGTGLEKSGSPFFWVLKTSKVDKDDDGEIKELLGESFFEKTKNKGIVVKGWADQEEILGHPSIGGFISHCGWNSVTESCRHGVPVLAWPLHGDQRVNAEVVEKAGLGVWERKWVWVGEKLIKGEEIGEKIKKMMGDEKLKAQAMKIRDEAKMAFEANGSSEKALQGVIDMVKRTI